MELNTANKITLFRVALIPVFLAVLLGELCGGATNIAACAIFIFASLTDVLDGYIARSRNMITNFGKFMDPLADKLLVCAALVVLTELGRVSSLFVIIIISRELIVMGFRTIAAGRNIILAADWSGKIKTVFQMLTVTALLLDLKIEHYGTLCLVLMVITIFLTVYSLCEYMIKNIGVLKE